MSVQPGEGFEIRGQSNCWQVQNGKEFIFTRSQLEGFVFYIN